MKTLFRISSITFVIILALSAVGPVSAGDSAKELAPAINEASNVGPGQSTNYVFRDITTTFVYSGGPVCLSSQGDQCHPPAIDDAVRIYVNGIEVYYHESYTLGFGPVDFSNKLHIGSNQVRVQLIDLIGPNRGGSALWLVSASIPVIQVSVQRDGDFFSLDGKGGTIPIERQPRAHVPFKITVTKNGNPVVAELQQLQPFNSYGGTTDSNGISTGSLLVSIPPQNGDVNIQYQATVDGVTATSNTSLLYHVSTLKYMSETLTDDDVKSWGGSLFEAYFLDSGIPTPEIKFRGVGGYEMILDIIIAALKMGVSYISYSPQVGDQITIAVYEFSAPAMTTAYLYREAGYRNGNLVFEHNNFTQDFTKIENIPIDPTHRGLNVWLASPATLFVTNPNGLSSGIEPTTGQRIFEYPMALSQTGEEPYRSFIPGAPNGKYSIQVVGTEEGTYTLSTYSLTHDGLATPTLSVTGLTYPGYITNFVVNYQDDTTLPVTLAVVGTVDVNPKTLNLKSMSGPNSVTTFIELPLGFDVRQIDLKTVMLEGVIPAQLRPTAVGDHNSNGIPDLMVKFDRKLLIDYLKSNNLFGSNVALTITGNYSETVQLTATDSIVVLNVNTPRAATTGVFRPSNGLLYLKNSNTTGFADIAINYGLAGDYPVVGDWDGNGTATIGVYRNGSFYLRNSNTLGFANLVFAFGQIGDQPIAGDWDGDGVDTVGVYRPSNGQFLLRNSNTGGPAEMSFYLGNVGDVGIAGDWNGDGLDTTGVFRPSNGIIFLKNTNATGFADIGLNYGIPGDKPVTGDWDNDGIDTIGVYRNGQFMLRNSNTVGFADIVFGLGNPGDMPIAGNWNGVP